MELGQVVIFREVFEPDDRLQYDKTRPYKHFLVLTEKLVLKSGNCARSSAMLTFFLTPTIEPRKIEI